MNWEAIGAMAEVVGVIAIFVSLVYLAVQIRQSTHQASLALKANELAAFERNIDSGNRVRELLILNPDLLELLSRGYVNYRQLDTPEKVRFGLLMRNMFSEMQGAFIRQQSLSHDPVSFKGSTAIIDSMVAHGGVREWLKRKEADWRPEFTEFVASRTAIAAEKESEAATAAALGDRQ